MSEVAKQIATKAENEISEYKKTELKYAPPFANTSSSLIDLIDLYWVDRFKGGDTDDDGWKRAFYNVIESPSLIATKEIDFDTKDIRIRAMEGQSYFPSWIFSRDLNIWMKQQQFGLVLNDIVYRLPKYGTVVVKKAAGNKVFVSDLSSISFEPTAKSLKESRFVVEEHEFSETELDDMNPIWKGTGQAKVEARKNKNKRVKVYERLGAQKGTKNNYHIVTKGGVMLFEGIKDVDDLYRLIQWDKIRGRILGRGVVEKLLEAQVNRNRLEEFKNKGLDWTSKKIYQTRDINFARNLLTDVENGEVLTGQGDLTQVNNQENNLPAYRDFEQSWDKSIRERTFSSPEAAGQRSPAGTPLGQSRDQIAQSNSFYEMKREELGIFIRDIIIDWVIPEFKKDRSIEHKIMLGEFNENEFGRFRAMLESKRVNESIAEFIGKNGYIPDDPTMELMKSTAQEQVRRQKDMTIPKSFYENLEYKTDVILTNEQIDVSAKLTTLQTIFTLLAQNPAILDDPRTKRLFNRWIDLGGVNPIDLQVDELPQPDEAVSPIAPTGSAPRPNPVPANARGADAVAV